MLLAHPQAEKEIAREVDSVAKDSPLTYADCGNLKYTRTFIFEVLRLYPPIPILLRQALKDDETQGYSSTAGSKVMLGLYHAHRNPEYWDEPERFNPHRFLAGSKIAPSAYFPFGGGRRVCIGKNFALLELIIITAMMVKQFSFIKPVHFNLKISYLSLFIRPQLDEISLKLKV